MSTRNKSATTKFLESVRGGPLTFGALLRSTRLCDEISQAELARLMHMSRAHICDIENNRRTVSIERASQFAKILGYSERQFVATVIEDQLRDAGMPFVVELKKAS
jgi:transcriptional regulator with XRE-family HTH domain